MAKNSVQKARTDKDSIEIHSYEQESPLPSAKELEDYQRVAPNLIPFFMDLARKEQEARHEVLRASMEAKEREDEATKRHQELINKNGKREFISTSIGQVFALISFLGVLALCWYALSLGAYWFSGILTALSIGVIVQAFLSKRKKE